MESVIDVSDCTENCKVKYVTHSLRGEALSWWNMVVLTKGRDAVNKISWEEFKALVIEKYCPYNEVEKIEAEF